MPLRILQVGKYYPPVPGGMESYVRALAEGLIPHSEVTVVVANTHLRRDEDLQNAPHVIRVPRIMEFRSMALCPSMAWELRRHPAHLVHLHFPDPMGHLAFLLSRRETKLVITWHSDIVRQGLLVKAYRPLLEDVIRRAAAIIVSSPAMLEHSPWIQAVRDRCHVIPFGVNLAQFELTETQRRRVEDLRRRCGESAVLFVGRLVYYKGLEYLLEAMQGLDARLWVVGSGPLEGQHRRLADRLGLRDRVEFLGGVSQEELLARLHACALLTLPSCERSETFGIVQLEAMACRKPVVSTNLPTGVPWVNQHGRTGLVVPPRDSEALRRAIRQLLDDPSLRQNLGEAGRKRVESQFTQEQHIQKVLNVYAAVLGQGG